MKHALHFVSVLAALLKNFQPIQNQVAVINTVYSAYPESGTSAAIIPIWQPLNSVNEL